MAADSRGDISPGRGGRSSAPSLPNSGAGESGANAGAELGVAASKTTHGANTICRTISFDNGDAYEGEIKDGKRHGKGVYKYANANVYDGEWKDDNRHGWGTLTWADGDVYEGQWVEGVKHGKGTFRWADGRVYDGEWRDGFYHGRGAMTFASGTVYDGEFKDDEMHGRGTATYATGNVYAGEWQDGVKHGRGTQTWRASGGVYDGEWEENEMHGVGSYTWACGDVYEGERRKGKMQGKGVLRYADGRVYDGGWKGGLQYGHGTMTLPSGDVYEGEWVRGSKNGQGTFTWKDGSVYEGEWVDGKQHGKGVMKYPSGDVYEGTWTDGSNIQAKKMRASGDITPCNGDSTSPPVGVGGTLAASLSSNADAQGEDRAPNASGGEQPEEKKRIYNERKFRSHRSQQHQLQKNAATKTCENCDVDDAQYKLRVCSGCNLALYCSAACQKAASRSHRRICNIISGLPSRDADRLALEYDRDKQNDFDASLRYATKYMDSLKHLSIDVKEMRSSGGALKLSAKRLSSLLKAKKGALDSIFWVSMGDIAIPGITENGYDVWKELHGLKKLQLFFSSFDDAQSLCDIIGQQKDTLEVLGLPFLQIDWSKAKTRRAVALAVSLCKQLVKLDLRGCVLMDTDLKIMLQDLPNLRFLSLRRDTRDTGNSHELTDNTCGLIARKCPGLQELNLDHHNQLSVRGIRKIIAGCPNLRSFYTTSCKLSSKDVRGLLDTAPQLMYLSLGDGVSFSAGELEDIIEATSGRTVLWSGLGVESVYEPKEEGVSAKTREKYDRTKYVLDKIWSKYDNPDVANEWESLFEG